MNRTSKWFLLLGIWSMGAIVWGDPPQIIVPGEQTSNRPAVFPNTSRPVPLGRTNQPSQMGNGTNLPSGNQNAISNLDNTLGTNQPNRGVSHPVTNRPNPNLQMP
jgi:hypothetical protein